MYTEQDEQHDVYAVDGGWGTVAEQKDEAFYDERSDASDDLTKGRVKFPRDKLYGRDAELKKLHSFFECIARKDDYDAGEDGKPRVVFLSGYSGIGKSALVEEVAKQLSKHSSRHFFISGKYEELQSADPFSAIAEALKKLTSELLRADSGELQRVRRNLKKSGVGEGDDGIVLRSTFPFLSPLLCKDDGVRETPASSTHVTFPMNQITHVFQVFMKALFTEENPAILFLDDLQWVDASSLQLISAFLTNKELLRHILFVGAYRSNEVDEDHPFYKRMKEIEDELGDSVERMELFNLSPSDIGDFIADTLGRSAEDVLPITEVIYSKTMGNIFYVMNALEELVRENAVYYDVMCFEWQWNVSKIELEDYLSEDVLEMVKSKVQNLPAIIQKAITLMAYTRNKVDVDTLHVLLEADGVSVNMAELTKLLARAVDEGLLMNTAGTSDYVFAHDRIQEAAYATISAGTDRDQMLIKTAEVLRDRGLSCGEDWMLFVAVDHFNSVMNNGSMSLDLAELNLRVAKLALQKSAYSQAVKLLRLGVANLDKDCRWNSYDFCLDLFNTLLSTEKTMGNYECAAAAIDEVLQNARSLGDKFTAHLALLDCVVQEGSRNYSCGAEKGLDVLKQYYCEVPLHPKKSDIRRERARMKRALNNRQISVLANLPLAADDSMFAFIARSMRYATLCGNDDLVTILSYRAISLTCSLGVTKYFATIFAMYATLLKKQDKFKEAYGYGNVSAHVLERFPEERGESYGYTLIALRSGILPLRHSFLESAEPLLQAHKCFFMHGNIEMALGSGMTYFAIFFATGLPLNALLEPKLLLYEEMSKKYGQKTFEAVFKIYRQTFLNLRGKSESHVALTGEAMDENEIISTFEGNARKMTIRDISCYRLQLAFIFWDKQTMREMVERLKTYPLFASDLSTCRQHQRLTYIGLASLALGREEKDKKYLQLGQRVVEFFNKLTKIGSVNARPVYLFLKAVNKPKKSAFIKAIDACSDSNLMHLEAMISERCAAFLQKSSSKNEELVQHYLTESYWLYNDWGATAKADELSEQHNFLRNIKRNGPPSKLSKIVKAAHHLQCDSTSIVTSFT